MSYRRVVPQGQAVPDFIKETGIDTRKGYRAYPHRARIDDADPGQAEATGTDRDPACLPEEFVAVAHADNQGVDAAEGGVHAVQLHDLFLRDLAFGLLVDMIHRESDIVGQFGQQLELLLVEIPDFAGVQ